MERLERPYFSGYLNDDCWRLLLEHLHLKDVFSVGQVCQQWNAVVQRYFQNSRLRIETIQTGWDVKDQRRRRKCKILKLYDLNEYGQIYLNDVLSKWGAFVVELVIDDRYANERTFEDVGVKCPNITDITFLGLKMESPSCEWIKSFAKLEHLWFENCSIPDSWVSEFINNNNIKKLVFQMTNTVTGNFFRTVNPEHLTNLHTLIFSRCPELRPIHLQTALERVNYLARVKRLELRNVPFYYEQIIMWILCRMPQLQVLTVDCEGFGWFTEELIGAVTRLKHLRYLGWSHGKVYTGRELKAVLKDGSRLKPPPDFVYRRPDRGPGELEAALRRDRRIYEEHLREIAQNRNERLASILQCSS